MFSVWLAQLSSLLLRCSLSCVVRSAYFSYCLRIARALSESAALLSGIAVHIAGVFDYDLRLMFSMH